MDTESCKVALCLQGGCAALASGGDGLAIDVVCHIARGVEALCLGAGAFGLEDVSVFIGIDEIAEELAIGHVPDGDKDALQVQFALFACDEIFQRHGADFPSVIGQVFGDGAVPDRLDFGIGERAVCHDLRGAEAVATMYEVDGGGELGEEACFFTGGVTAADDGYRDIPVKGTVAGGATGQTMADEALFIGQSKVPWGCAGGDDHGACFPDGAIIGDDFEVASVHFFDVLDQSVFDACAKAFCLGLHVHHQFGSLDAFGEARKVFHFRRRGELAAGLIACEDERIEVGAACIDSGGVAGAAGANDDDVFHEFMRTNWGKCSRIVKSDGLWSTTQRAD